MWEGNKPRSIQLVPSQRDWTPPLQVWMWEHIVSSPESQTQHTQHQSGPKLTKKPRVLQSKLAFYYCMVIQAPSLYQQVTFSKCLSALDARCSLEPVLIKHILSTPKIYPPCDAASFWYVHGGTPERRYVLCILTRVEAAITESISTWNTWGVEEKHPYLVINNLHMQGHKSHLPAALQISAVWLLLIRSWVSGKLSGLNLWEPVLSLILINFFLQWILAEIKAGLNSPCILQLWKEFTWQI